MEATLTRSDFSRLKLGTPILVLMMLSMMVLPLPPLILDILFTFNISLSLVVLLACVYTIRPLNFSIFPTLLLLATLLRLALNVASTRVVLLNGHTGTHAAGQVVESFGSVVIGGNYAVGLIVFSILVIINFIVVTKGAGRVSEVTARFTLDAMPGKQMAIDADLNAGIINQDTAKARRQDIANEADFYGAMDGASKFVRGDAIASILILLINIIGGLIIGTTQHQMAFNHAIHNYTLLTIGDGLVAQLPSLLLSTATAIIVTRATSSQDMSGQLLQQLFGTPNALFVTGVVLALLGLIPGMPHLAFLALAGATSIAGFAIANRQRNELAESKRLAQEPAEEESINELTWQDVIPADLVGLEVGYRLIKLADNEHGQLMTRIKGVRKKLSQEIGFLLPPVHVRDNLDLKPNGYRISIMGVNCGEAIAHPDKIMAINPGQEFDDIKGIRTKDPTFGLDATWIRPDQRVEAQQLGYTVVDCETVMATHISHILQQHAAELLGHEEAQQLLDRLALSAPKLVAALVPNALSLSLLVRVLRLLLAEKIPVIDLRNIASALIEGATKSQEPEVLLTTVRYQLRRLIVQRIIGLANHISVVVLDQALEQILQLSQPTSTTGGLGMEPGLADKLIHSLTQFEQQQKRTGMALTLLCSAQLRLPLSTFLRHSLPDLHVLAYNEIPDDKQVNILGTITQ